jgi:SAM-dependent methyltransferase
LLTYEWRGKKPWGRGYFEYKWRLIGQTLANAETLTAFASESSLTKGFGHGIDERIVEYPWLIANLPPEPLRLLDAGSALNFETLLIHPKLANKKITIVNLNPESSCFSHLGVSYLFEDLRHLPIVDNTFDVITCISTLEHIGMDNTKIYTTDEKYKEQKTEDYLIAARELRRVLKPEGSLFLTVPFGIKGNFGFFQQFDKAMLAKLIAVFDKKKSRSTFYKYTKSGWQISSLAESTSAEYVTADRAKLDPSLPAAAAAVACLKLIR